MYCIVCTAKTTAKSLCLSCADEIQEESEDLELDIELQLLVNPSGKTAVKPNLDE